MKPPKIRAELAALGIDSAIVDKHVTLTTTLTGALNLLEKWRGISWNSHNGGAMAGYLGDSRDDSTFQGGTIADLRRNLASGPDMAPFQAQMAELERSGFTRHFKTETWQIKPLRKRRFSEHDGEWSYDRRYEIQPFQATTKTNTPTRVLRIRAQFSVSGAAHSKDIDKYGALVWAICQLIERSGIQTEIIWADDCLGIDDSKVLNANIEVLVKKPGQYLAPSMLATCFSTLFFRRIGFAFIVASANTAGFASSYGLGRPKKGHTVLFEDNTLHLSPSAVFGCDDELKAEILKAMRA